MKILDFRTFWFRFLHWNGWKATAGFCNNAWRATVGWKGWKIFYYIPYPILVLLGILCGLGLLWVFANGMENQIPAYILYPVSAYALAALCVKLPGAVRFVNDWLNAHPKLTAFLRNEELQFDLGLYLEQIINFFFGGFKILSGIVLGSAWIGCEGIYNFVQALIQLYQILRRKKMGDLGRQWQSYRFCGVLILLMHLTLTGIVFQMIHWNRSEEQGQIQLIATAVFAFYKMISAFISIAKDRKHIHPVNSSIRMLNLTQAMFAIFSLQASMFHTFGTGESWEHLMNILTGCTVCLLIVSTGLYMIRRANRQIKLLKENENGTESFF